MEQQWQAGDAPIQTHRYTDKEVVYGEPQTEPHDIFNSSYSHQLTWSIFGFFLFVVLKKKNERNPKNPNNKTNQTTKKKTQENPKQVSILFANV